MKFLIAIVAGLLLGVITADADACGRCGLFGRKCRFSHNVSPVVYQPPATTTNFVFNNLFPTQFPYLLAQGGNSIYGVQTASAAYAESPAFYMDRAARFTDRAFDLAQTGQQMFSENSALALKVSDDMDRRHTNAQIAVLAMEANRGTTQQTLQVQITDGKMSIVQPSAPQPVTQGPQKLVTAQACGACHDGRGTNGAPKEIVLDGSVGLSLDELIRCNKAVRLGKMPPNSNLTPEQKDAVQASLGLLLQSGQQPPPQLPPPDGNGNLR